MKSNFVCGFARSEFEHWGSHPKSADLILFQFWVLIESFDYIVVKALAMVSVFI